MLMAALVLAFGQVVEYLNPTIPIAVRDVYHSELADVALYACVATLAGHGRHAAYAACEPVIVHIGFAYMVAGIMCGHLSP